MLHKLKACSFLLAMLCLVVFKHPVIGFCLCENNFFIGQHDHQHAHHGHSCDHHHHAHQQTDEHPNQPLHCPDCHDDGHCDLRITLDPGDFLWQASNHHFVSAAQDLTPQLTEHPSLHFSPSTNLRSLPLLRPPPDIHIPALPLFLSFANFRI